MYRWVLLFLYAPLLPGQSAQINVMLSNSVEAWNRGDLVAFVSDYEDSAETTYVGREVVSSPRHDGAPMKIELLLEKNPSTTTRPRTTEPLPSSGPHQPSFSTGGDKTKDRNVEPVQCADS